MGFGNKLQTYVIHLPENVWYKVITYHFTAMPITTAIMSTEGTTPPITTRFGNSVLEDVFGSMTEREKQIDDQQKFNPKFPFCYKRIRRHLIQTSKSTTDLLF